MLKKISILAGTAIGLLAASSSYGQITYDTLSGAHDSDGSLDASAQFTLSGDTLTIVLTDLEANPNSIGQVVSGIDFNVSGPATIGLAGGTGALTHINSDGTYTPQAATPNNLGGEWNLFGSSSQPNLNVFNFGTPDYMIIGPDSRGGLSGAGIYSGNASITDGHFDPFVLGSATFTFDVTGLTSLNQISGVQIQFGTGPDCYQTVTTPTPVPVPEPTTIIAGLLMLVPLSVQLLRFTRGLKRSEALIAVK